MSVLKRYTIIYLKLIKMELFVFIHLFSQVQNITERKIVIFTTGLRGRDNTHKHLT